jgi:Flp pilus assembly protein TadB
MDPYLSATAVCAGLSVAAAARLAAGTDQPLPDRERRRRDDLRRRSFVYRHLGGLVAALGPVYRFYGAGLRDRVTADLEVLDDGDWRADEFLAARHLGLTPVVAAAAAAAAAYSGLLVGLALGLGLLAVAPVLVARSARGRAARRVRAVRGRLPYTLDLMALVLDAGGGTLFDCLRLGAEENAGHPLGEEYRRVVGAVDKGVAPAAALAEMTRRLGDPDVAEVNLAIATAEARGLPLRDALQAIGTRLRARQVQWMERAAEEAKVHITWPAMLVMVACLIVVVAPFLAGLFSATGW